MTNLVELYVNVAGRNFGWPGFRAIINPIKNLKKIENLILKLAVNKVGSPGAGDLIDLFKNLHKLKSVNVDFTESYLGKDNAFMMNQLVDAILENNKDLKEFDFTIAFNDLGNEGSLEVAKTLLKFKGLDKLRFDLSRNEVYDDHALKIMKIVEQVAEQNSNFEFSFTGTAISYELYEELKAKYANWPKLNFKVSSVKNPKSQTEEKN